MVLGIGIDAATVDDFAVLCDCDEAAVGQCAGSNASLVETALESPFALYTFTEAECRQLRQAPRLFETMAGLFAVKEATFKAVAHLTVERTFDFREVEVLHREDGWPYVNATSELRKLLDQAGVSDLLVSITNESNLAIAIVIAQ